MAVWRWLIIGLLVLLCLGACTAVPDPTPTPVQNVAEVATLVVERPSATSLPTLTPTPQPTNTPELVVTDEMPRVTAVPTVTPVPTFTPIPSPTPDPHLSQVSNSNGGISHVTVSSLGQLAFIEGSVLWVETAAGAGEFVEVGSYAQPAVWSPDGSQLLYSLTNTFDIFHDPNASFEQRLWSAVDGSDISLSELITNYSSPPYNVFQAFWSPDSTKILMQATLDKRHEDDIIAYDNILLTIDFSQHTLKDDRFISSKVYPVWFAHDVYILRYHCGSPCAGFASQNYFGESLWFEGSTTGFVDFAATDNFMILAGHTDVPPPYSSTLDEINLLTGEKRVIWEAPSDGDYFTPFFDPSISPDEQFIAFNYGGGPHVQEVTYVLYVIDRNGQEIGQYPRSSFVDWRPNGELTINRILESDVNQLVNLTASGESQIIFTTEPGTFLAKVAFYEKGDGKWSPDGRYFIFTTENYEKDLTQLYVWLSETEEVRLVLTEEQDYGSQFIWLPDSTAFYFIINGVIWRYEMETAD